jgi:hypothetical protein
MAGWILGEPAVFGYEFADLELGEAARRAPLVVRAAWTGGIRLVTLYHGRVPASASLALWAGPNEPLRRELLDQWTAGAWQAWSYTRASKRSAVTEHAITVALRPNPKPSDLAFPDFETADHMEEA